MLHGDDTVECSVLKKLAGTAGDVLRVTLMRERQTRLEPVQHAAIASLQRKAKQYHWQRYKGDWRDRPRRSATNDGEGSPKNTEKRFRRKK